MIMKIFLALTALLSTLILAEYQRAPINFDPNLKCTACIRGGWNYCVNITGDE